jgi:probable rRNA maturation factor
MMPAAATPATVGSMARSVSRLSVSVVDYRGRSVRRDGLGSWLARVAPRSAAGQVAVALVADHRMRRLNRDYRGKDALTDVLSFPASDEYEPPRFRAGDRIGDIVIATGVAARQAARLGHSLRDELRVLALHGLLHLLGYDHDRDAGAMERAERRLAKRGGLPAGLIDRTGT